MLTELWKSTLPMSVAGSALAFILLCLKPITRKLFSPRWQYYIWLSVLIVMMLPVSFSLPYQAPEKIPVGQTVQFSDLPQTIETGTQIGTGAVQDPLPAASPIRNINIPQNWMFYSGLLWFFGVLFKFFFKITRYGMFLREIRKHSNKDITLSNLPRRLKIRRTDMLDAPLLVGLLKPVLYLPAAELNETDLNYIFMHELTHYKRCDLLYKWAAMLVECVHWFNPLVYAVSKQIDLDCEVSCDFAVVSRFSEPEKTTGQ